MPVSFAQVERGTSYSRHQLAELWGYASWEALARGVVTPRQDNKIILFVTQEKHSTAEQYEDRLIGDVLHWEGPNDHFAEDRMLAAPQAGDEIHLFFRDRPNDDFVYQGELSVVSCENMTDRPSKFVFKVT